MALSKNAGRLFRAGFRRTACIFPPWGGGIHFHFHFHFFALISQDIKNETRDKHLFCRPPSLPWIDGLAIRYRSLLGFCGFTVVKPHGGGPKIRANFSVGFCKTNYPLIFNFLVVYYDAMIGLVR
jgi:hypothetical protein